MAEFVQSQVRKIFWNNKVRDAIFSGERVLACDAVKNVLSLMFSCGMYNYSGQFAFQVSYKEMLKRI